jgi:hypothetical protein
LFTPSEFTEPSDESAESALTPVEGEPIPVQSQRDPTQEISISHIDFNTYSEAAKPSAPPHNTIKIKVRDGRKRAADDPTAE